MICTAVLVFGWMLVPLRLSGISMLPTYQDGALNFANRTAYWISEPARGDVVAIRMAGPHAFYVKRIIGMPGERIEIGAESGPQVYTCVRGATELGAEQSAVPLVAGSTAVLFADAGPALISSSTGGRVLRAWVGD